MKLSELFNYLTYGELNNLKVGGKEDGGIYPKYSDEVVTYITQGLSALHSRFELKQNELVIQQFEEITDYIIQPEYSQYNEDSTEPKRWIMDLPNSPYSGDLIRISEVFNEGGVRMPLNDSMDPTSMTTPRFDILQMPMPDPENAYAVLYVADHDPIDLTNLAPKDININIPTPLVRALVLYVSSLAHTAVGSPEGVNTGFAKMQEYEAVCIGMELQGTIAKETWELDKIRRDGWV